MLGQCIDVVLRELKWQEVRVGEVAVIMRFLLGTHWARLALLRVVQARLLLDPAAFLQDFDLTSRLIVDRLTDEVYRIEVLDLAASTKRLARPADGDIHVG